MKKLISAIFVLLWALGLSQDFRKGPYLLYPAQNNQMIIVWQLTSTANCSVAIGTDSTSWDTTITSTEANTAHVHVLLLDSLKPGTKYFYKIQCGNQSKIATFFTGPADTVRNISFYAYGDTRTYPNSHNQVAGQILNQIQQDPASQTFIILSGDLVTDGNDENDWDNEFFNPQYQNIQQLLAIMPYVIAIGNHEMHDYVFRKYFPYPWYQNNRFYVSFDYGPVHVAIIDQYVDYSVGSEQYNWLKNDLASSDKPWKIIALHEPGWSAGGHSNETEVQQAIQPLCEQYGVQFVIGGHNHYYAHAVVNGVHHITTGGGGAPLYDCNPNYPNVVRCESCLHFCKFEINGDSLRFSAIRSNGSVIETFSISAETSTVSEQDSEISVSLTNGWLEIKSPDSVIEQVEVFDLQGKQIYSKRLWGAKSAKLRLPTTGVYLVKVKLKDQTIVKKVVRL